jgi:hypothetical protein
MDGSPHTNTLQINHTNAKVIATAYPIFNTSGFIFFLLSKQKVTPALNP